VERKHMQHATRGKQCTSITAAGAAALVKSGDWVDYGIAGSVR
jgi:hypothetical protein